MDVQKWKAEQDEKVRQVIDSKRAEFLAEIERIHAENLARVTSPAYLKTERSVTRSQKAIRRAV
jgi:hypothetical protein